MSIYILFSDHLVVIICTVQTYNWLKYNFKMICVATNLKIYALRSETIAHKLSTKKSTSSFVFSSPKLTLKVPLMYSDGKPIATSTCDGSASPELQAEPTEVQIPNRI